LKINSNNFEKDPETLKNNVAAKLKSFLRCFWLFLKNSAKFCFHNNILAVRLRKIIIKENAYAFTSNPVLNYLDISNNLFAGMPKKLINSFCNFLFYFWQIPRFRGILLS